MSSQYNYKGNAISYLDKGEGKTIVLLHGYLETKEVWDSFADKLSEDFRVIALDIPGHGLSDNIAETHTMELLAESTNALLINLKIDKCTMVGHSMGGYIMLSFADMYPQKLDGLVLFHSSIYADTDEKIAGRLKDIKLIEDNKLKYITNISIPQTFANDNVVGFSKSINIIKNRALTHNSLGVCAVLRGMTERYDKQKMITNLQVPMLFIFGMKDNYIPVNVGGEMAKLNNYIELKLLENSGHMGFVEEEDEALKTITAFIKNQKKYTECNIIYIPLTLLVVNTH